MPQWIGTAGVAAATGIIVNGSLTGQNLLQGSSGVTDFDTLGHYAPYSSSTANNGTGVLEGEFPLQNYRVGNDTLTGGTGSGILNGQGIHAGQFNDAQTWVTGDNFFPEGGIDTVNLSHAATKTAYDAVWVGMFDVSSYITGNAAGFTTTGTVVPGDAPHYVFGQAITDIVRRRRDLRRRLWPRRHGRTGKSPEGAAVAASGSNTSLLTINGFIEGNNTVSGDI